MTKETKNTLPERLIEFDKTGKYYIEILDNTEKALLEQESEETLKKRLEELTREIKNISEKINEYKDIGDGYSVLKKYIATKIRRINKLITERQKISPNPEVETPETSKEENKNTDTQKIELPKLKGFVDNLVAEETIKIERALEDKANKNDSRMIEFLENKKALLEENPIEYFTKEKIKFQAQLEAIENNKKYTKKQKEDEGDLLKYKVKELQRAIIGIEELSGKKRKTPPVIAKIEIKQKEKKEKKGIGAYYARLITETAAALALILSQSGKPKDSAEKPRETIAESKITNTPTLEEIRETENKKFKDAWAQIEIAEAKRSKASVLEKTPQATEVPEIIEKKMAPKNTKLKKNLLKPIERIKQRIYAQLNTIIPEKPAPKQSPVEFAPIIVDDLNEVPPKQEIKITEETPPENPTVEELQKKYKPEDILKEKIEAQIDAATEEKLPEPTPVETIPEPSPVITKPRLSWFRKFFH